MKQSNDPWKKLLRVNVNELLLHCTAWRSEVFPLNFPIFSLSALRLKLCLCNNSIYDQILFNRLTLLRCFSSKIFLRLNISSRPTIATWEMHKSPSCILSMPSFLSLALLNFNINRKKMFSIPKNVQHQQMQYFSFLSTWQLFFQAILKCTFRLPWKRIAIEIPFNYANVLERSERESGGKKI